jgi:hypothetical protein
MRSAAEVNEFCRVAIGRNNHRITNGLRSGLNFAGVFKAPCIFICRNNGWAISTAANKQTAARTVAQRAIAYGIAGARIDGNDLYAVLATMEDAVARARAGEGRLGCPSLPRPRNDAGVRRGQVRLQVRQERLVIEHDMVDVIQRASAFFQAVRERIARESSIVLFSAEALFLCRSQYLAVAYEGSRAVVVIGGNADDPHESRLRCRARKGYR